MAGQLQGKVAVVTGSTSGIGQGIAEAFAREGASVMLNGFGDKAGIESLRARLERDSGAKSLYDAADMSKPDEIAAISSIFTNCLVGCGARMMSLIARSRDTLFSRARSSICFSTSGVRTKPGQIELQRIALSATSRATDLVSPMMPCFAATYAVL